MIEGFDTEAVNNSHDTTYLRRYKKWVINIFLLASSTIITLVMVINNLQKPVLHMYKKDSSRDGWWQNEQTEKMSHTLIKKPKNFIMMISDGLGPASVTFARTYYQYINDKPYDYRLPIETIQVGQSRTRSSNTLVTDSAAGATAFSCAMKTYNGAIGVDPGKRACGTVLESAKHQQNMLTGLVVTSRITHATPAAFSAHVDNRESENDVAKQQIGENPLGLSVDLLFGGGYCHFLPSTEKNGCRLDSRNLLEEAKLKYNWTTVIHGDKQAFNNLPADPSVLPVMSLFTPDHMSFEIDRDPDVEPSLTEMTEKALDILYQSVEDKEKGFFLMIEGSRIDMAAHSNDAATHVHEILEYQNTIELVKKYIDKHPDTVMVSTSDHETGGLSLAKQTTEEYPTFYLWYPDVLMSVKRSTEILSTMMKSKKELTREYILNTILEDNLGITDATEAELIELLNSTTKSALDLGQYLADMVSFRAQLGWSTHGHSGVDVNLYSYGIGSEYLIGNHENIEIGEFITKALDLNLTEVTLLLNEQDPTFHLTKLTNKDKLKYNHELEKYHHVIGAL